MTLLSIAQAVAQDVGIDPPTEVVASTDRDVMELLICINTTGEEISRRVAWGALTTEETITGDGTSTAKTVGSVNPFGTSVMRLVDGVTVTTPSGSIVRPLTRAEWNMADVEGTPRYFLFERASIRLWPYLANSATVTVRYQTSKWTSDDTLVFTKDDQTALFSEVIIVKGAIARWRRQKGMPYQDQEVEYETALAEFADFDDRGRL